MRRFASILLILGASSSMAAGPLFKHSDNQTPTGGLFKPAVTPRYGGPTTGTTPRGRFAKSGSAVAGQNLDVGATTTMPVQPQGAIDSSEPTFTPSMPANNSIAPSDNSHDEAAGQREFENVYHDITYPKISTGTAQNLTILNASISSITVTGSITGIPSYPTNILDNGGFEIWQRGTSFSNPALLAYLSDRFFTDTTEAAGVTVTKETSIIDGVGLASMKVVTSASGASKTWQVQQRVENYADYRGKVVTMSARVKTTVANAVKVGINDGVASATYSSYHTGSGNWETLSVSITMNSAASELYIYIGMTAAGDKKDGTYYFDSAMLNVGSPAVTFVPTNPSADLSRCQRFFQIFGDSSGNGYAPAKVNTTTQAIAVYRLVPDMRVAPSMTVNNVTHFRVETAAGATNAMSTITANTLSPEVVSLVLTAGTANLVAGNATLLSTTNSDATIYFSSDL